MPAVPVTPLDTAAISTGTPTPAFSFAQQGDARVDSLSAAPATSCSQDVDGSADGEGPPDVVTIPADDADPGSGSVPATTGDANGAGTANGRPGGKFWPRRS
jgi:hypothetical protein